tara:strand:- start:1813 stop:2064 length:252 start_codon:yes stop_codon:yes gene_type:complete
MTKKIYMFRERILINNPRVLIREELPPSDFMFRVEKKKGLFYLVIPDSAREVYYIQMLGKNIDMFLPVEGEGLLIKRSAVDNL